MATDIPVVLLDIAGFSRLETIPEKRALLHRFQALIVACLKPHAGRADPLQAFDWHDTGDGFYLTMKGYPSPVALRFALDLEKKLKENNQKHGEYPLRLRIGLTLGDLEEVGNQRLSDAFTEATRLIDHAQVKALLEMAQWQRPAILVTSKLFMDNWKNHREKDEDDVNVPPGLPWSRVEFEIKHGKQLTGYIQAEESLVHIVRGGQPPLSPVSPPPPPPPPVSPSPSPDDDLKLWLRRMLNETQFIKVSGIGSGRGVKKKVEPHYPIEDLYTILRSRGGEIRPEETPETDLMDRFSETDLMNRFRRLHPGSEENAPESLAKFLPKHHRLLIEGQAGAGKTTFLHLAFTMLARDYLDEPGPDGRSWRECHLGLPGEAKVKIPLFIKLSRLVDRLDGAKAIDRTLLLDLLEEELPKDAQERLKAWRQAWEHWLAAGEVMLLLDGLDEVAGESKRENFRLLLLDVVEHWDKCPLVVSSRPYQTQFLKPSKSSANHRTKPPKPFNFHPVMIEPFAEEEIREFLDRWVAVLNGLPIGQDPGGEQGQLREKLDQTIRQRAEIRRMATNPVMLTCLCVVHWNEGELPDGRSRLYQAVTTWLRRARQSLRSQHGFSDRLAETAFLQLALAMMGDSTKPKRATLGYGDAAQAVFDAVSRNFPDLAQADCRLKAKEWLEFEAIWSGLIEDTGRSEIRFWHLTFQEYLAARQLTQLPGDDATNVPGWWPIIQQSLADPQWRETVELFPGCLFDANGESAVDGLLKRVLDDREIERLPLVDDARSAGSVGRLLKPMKVYDYRPSPAIKAKYQEVLSRSLAIFEPEGAAQVPIKIRLDAAEAIGQNGDRRLQGGNLLPVPGTDWKLGKYPVTVMEYQRFMEQEGYREQRWWDEAGWSFREKHGLNEPEDWDDQCLHLNRPVTGVSWFEAMAYCRWLSDQWRDKYKAIRLPDETVWEKAATAPKGKYPWGKAEPTPELANFGQNVNAPTPVGLYPAGNGPQGHCDLAGNVWEWQRNLYGNKNGTEVPLDPVVTEGDNPVVRGGCWLYSADYLRSAYRSRYDAWLRSGDLGFRVAAAPASR